jgi:hypothetical protein
VTKATKEILALQVHQELPEPKEIPERKEIQALKVL